MAHSYHDLKHMTVAQLREIAAGIQHDAVQGYTQLNKEHLLVAICNALGIDMHEHHEVKGVDKARIKTKIRTLKKEREQALTAKDREKLLAVRKQIKTLKKKLRKAMV